MTSEADPLGLIGTTIAEKYAVESVVGEGGFAIVYRASHVVWKRPVALKVFKALGEVAKEDRQKLLDDFIQEGALLADLSERSPAICQARDVGMLATPGAAGDQVPYMVLEWLEGAPLESVLEREKAAGLPLRSLEQTIRLLDAVAEALALAHKKGIAHRDIKPANVFVLGDPRGEDTSVKLLDFGIAKVVQDAQKMGFGKTAGHLTSFTPSYGAPEQFNRAYGATGPWTDVFALSLVASEVLSGREPIAGDTLVQLAYASSDPARRPTPRSFGVQISDDVEAVFQKAVAVKPEERFQTAGEFWNALRRVASGHPMSSMSAVRSVGADSSDAMAATVIAPTSSPASSPSSPWTGRDSPPDAATHGPASAAVVPPTSLGATGIPVAPPKKSPLPFLALGLAVAVAVAGGALAFQARGTTNSSAPSSSVTAPVPAASVSAVVSAPATTCPEGMKRIPGGTYFMGSAEKDADPNEKPPHSVKVSPYCLDEFEVTVDKFKAASDVGKVLRASKTNYFEGITKAQSEIYDPLCNINDPVGRKNHPINCVTWEQAKKYCEANDARLPTEAEWEFAARTSDGRIYPWGDDPPSAKLLNACGKECVVWMKKHPDPDQPPETMYDEDDGFPATAPVGSFPQGKSRWGIQDIAGNVWEWVADYYGVYDPASADTLAVDPKGPISGKNRVIRGGAWNGAKPAWVRPAWRFEQDPTSQTHGIGFRCAKSP